MGELKTEEIADVIRALKEQHPGAGSGSHLEMFFRTKPLTLHFCASLLARGALTDLRKATDTFLRSLPKELYAAQTGHGESAADHFRDVLDYPSHGGGMKQKSIGLACLALTLGTIIALKAGYSQANNPYTYGVMVILN